MPPICGKRQLTRDEGIQILVYQQIDMIYEAIAKLFRNVSPYQVEYLVQKGHPTPAKRSSQPPIITDDQLQELITFVCASTHNCRLSWAQLPLEYFMCT